MIFQTSNSIGKILRGEKTQTRRIVKSGQGYASDYFNDDQFIKTAVINEKGNIVYAVNSTYAVQPGRGKAGVFYFGTEWGFSHDSQHDPNFPTNPYRTYQIGSAFGERLGWRPLRIRILAIRQEDVRNISEDDARAEGYDSPISFLIDWCSMHDKQAFPKSITPDRYWRETLLKERPADRYTAWALTFEMVK